MLKLVQQALDDSEQVQREKLRPPLEVLSYQKSLIELVRQLEGIRDELAQAKPRLAAVMNLEPGTAFRLKTPSDLPVPSVADSLAQMETRALLQAPDIAEAQLQERISANEVKKAIARLLPGIELNLGENYDSNAYLHNHNWAEGGLRVTWNLLNLLSGPTQKRVAEQQLEMARVQRLALDMALLAQVHISYRDFTGRKRQYELSQKLFAIDRAINEQTMTAATNDAQSRLNSIRSDASELMADYRRYQSYAALQASYGQLIATQGADPLPDQVVGQDLRSLAQAIAARLDVTDNLTPPAAAPASAEGS